MKIVIYPKMDTAKSMPRTYELSTMEPEDARFSRDLRWIIDALQTAFKLGKKENSNAKKQKKR